jgi:hypothetical protein
VQHDARLGAAVCQAGGIVDGDGFDCEVSMGVHDRSILSNRADRRKGRIRDISMRAKGSFVIWNLTGFGIGPGYLWGWLGDDLKGD